jgi:hypothetical protein
VYQALHKLVADIIMVILMAVVVVFIPTALAATNLAVDAQDYTADG